MLKIQNKKDFYVGTVWIVSAISLIVYGILVLEGKKIPGVEQIVDYVSSVQGVYIYAGAFLTAFIEGIYVVGSFFPGSTIIVILAILSQVGGISSFLATIVAIFLGWVLAGAVNIFLTKVFHIHVLKQEEATYLVRDNIWTTWFPAFRANYEVSQITEGGNVYKVFLSSVRVKLLTSIVMLLIMLLIPLFIDIQEVTNEESLLSVAVVICITLVVGIVKIKKSLKNERNKADTSTGAWGEQENPLLLFSE